MARGGKGTGVVPGGGGPAPVDLSGVAMGIGAGIFGIIGGLAAASQNRAIAKAAKLSMERVNLFITNLRVNAIWAIAQVAYEGQNRLGNITNAVSPRGISKQESLMNKVNDPTEFATWGQYESLKRREQAAHNMKVDIAARGVSASSNVVAEALKSAGGGATLAGEIFTAFENSRNAEAINSLQQGQFASRTAGAKADLKGLEASIRDAGLLFRTEEEMVALMGVLTGLREQGARNQTALTFLYSQLEQARTRPERESLRDASITTSDGPPDFLARIGLDF